MKLDIIKQKYEEKGFRPTTISSYLSSIKRISKEVFDTTAEELKPMDLTEKTKIMKYIKERKGNVGVTLLNGVINLIKILDGFPPEIFMFYQDQFNKLSHIKNEDRILKRPTDDELINFISFDNLKIIRDQLKEKLTDEYLGRSYLPYLIVSLYCEFPPLRSQDWINTRIFETLPDDDEELPDNYLIIDDGKMILHNYKTSRSYGRRVLNLPKKLMNIIKFVHLKNKSIWLLPNSLNNDIHITNSHLAHYLHTSLGKKISSSTLRKLYISKLKRDGASIDVLKKVAKIMGHSVSTAYLIYGRFVKETGANLPENYR